MVVDHVFPADGEYVFEVTLNAGDNARYEDIDISVDGERVALLAYETAPAGGADGRGANGIMTEPVLVRAGQQKVAAAFVRRSEGPYEDLIRPHDWSFAGGGSGGGGITTLPHLRDLIIRGPYKTTGVSQTPSRQKIVYLPSDVARRRGEVRARDRHADGQRSVSASRLAARDRPLDAVLPEGRRRGRIRGRRAAPRSRRFCRVRTSSSGSSGNPKPASRATLSSRRSRSRVAPVVLHLGHVAGQGTCRRGGAGQAVDAGHARERQTRRMLADPRAEALGRRFAAQWLRLQDIDKVKPDPNFYPNFDDNLAEHDAPRDRAVLQQPRARGSQRARPLSRRLHVHERAPRPPLRHPRRRRQRFPQGDSIPTIARRGILGQGSMLVQTSMANRTSPVLRGKWVMEVLLGTPPPPPPPDVPDLEAAGEAKEGRVLTTRERMEIHRANPTCNSCHRFMDPIGLALDNFDVTGRWRAREYGSALDTRGDFYDGTTIASAARARRRAA